MTPQHAQYYETIINKPLLHGSLIESGGKRFTTIRWFFEDKHCFEFEYIGSNDETSCDNFVRKPSEITSAIKKGIIKIVKII